MIPKNPKHGKKQHPKVDKLRIKTTNSKIPTNHSKMMAKCSKKRRRKGKGCSRCGGLVEHGLFMSIYLHSRSFGGQMYLAKYNTDIENLAAGIYCIYVYYTFEHLYTARYGIIIGPLWASFTKLRDKRWDVDGSLSPLASWVDTSYKMLQVLLVLTWFFQHTWWTPSTFCGFGNTSNPHASHGSWLEFRSKRPSHANTRSSEDLVVKLWRGKVTPTAATHTLLKSSSQHKQAPTKRHTRRVGEHFHSLFHLFNWKSLGIISPISVPTHVLSQSPLC